jgi:glycosyltransferase involved in cell wall biosynthesis
MQHAISSADAKRSLGYPANSVVLSIFGFIGNYKGHDLAIESLASLPENYHLAIVGGMHPESKDAFLDKLLSTMPESIAHRVYITGWVDRETADRYFAATDVCLAPYRGDTMLSGSGAITWGLSSGRPVVASKIEAFQNLDRVGNCLFLVTPEKTAELTSAIQKVVSDPTLRDRLVTNATRFCEMNSWSNSVGKIARVYETTLLGNAARSGLNNYPMFAVA